jgi:hypothetical protein
LYSIKTSPVGPLHAFNRIKLDSVDSVNDCPVTKLIELYLIIAWHVDIDALETEPTQGVEYVQTEELQSNSC